MRGTVAKRLRQQARVLATANKSFPRYIVRNGGIYVFGGVRFFLRYLKKLHRLGIGANLPVFPDNPPTATEETRP